jgi:hypothetical protein
MNDDSAMAYLAAAVRLAGVDRFYTRRVLQRCQRGELTIMGAAELLMAAAEDGGARTNGGGVRRWLPDTLS